MVKVIIKGLRLRGSKGFLDLRKGGTLGSEVVWVATVNVIIKGVGVSRHLTPRWV